MTPDSLRALVDAADAVHKACATPAQVDRYLKPVSRDDVAALARIALTAYEMLEQLALLREAALKVTETNLRNHINAALGEEKK